MTGRKVLIIDDEPDIHKLLRVILEGEGLQIVGPEEHREAKKSVQGGRPDIIILDIMMPEVDGFDILRMIKGDKDTRHIPVIVLTVRTLIKDMEKAMALGADRYITKPFEPAELVEAVKAVLSRQDAGCYSE